MMFFKTRKEVQSLRREVELLTDMLKTHFDIKYTFDDYKSWCERHPDANNVPVTEGEWLHYGDMLSRVGSKSTKAEPNQMFSFRDKRVLPIRKYTEE